MIVKNVLRTFQQQYQMNMLICEQNDSYTLFVIVLLFLIVIFQRDDALRYKAECE